jgi:hypothetical protein
LPLPGLDGLLGEVELLPVPPPVAELPVPPVFGWPCLSPPGGQPSALARSAAAMSPFHPFRSVI